MNSNIYSERKSQYVVPGRIHSDPRQGEKDTWYVELLEQWGRIRGTVKDQEGCPWTGKRRKDIHKIPSCIKGKIWKKNLPLLSLFLCVILSFLLLQILIDTCSFKSHLQNIKGYFLRAPILTLILRWVYTDANQKWKGNLSLKYNPLKHSFPSTPVLSLSRFLALFTCSLNRSSQFN